MTESLLTNSYQPQICKQLFRSNQETECISSQTELLSEFLTGGGEHEQLGGKKEGRKTKEGRKKGS